MEHTGYLFSNDSREKFFVKYKQLFCEFETVLKIFFSKKKKKRRLIINYIGKLQCKQLGI